eukprot:6203128-Pleurochrysis_carterae.AAC.5
MPLTADTTSPNGSFLCISLSGRATRTSSPSLPRARSERAYGTSPRPSSLAEALTCLVSRLESQCSQHP